jgi:uracil-DNA glycosylase
MAKSTIEKLRAEAAHCRACDLWKRATQTVFGEGGGEKPRLMFIGEQPGDQEDIQGRPFVGPAGKTRQSIGRSRHRSERGLFNECRKTLQMGAARETPDSQEAEFDRDHGVQVVD